MLRIHYNSKYDLISALSKLLLNATNNFNLAFGPFKPLEKNKTLLCELVTTTIVCVSWTHNTIKGT